MQKLFWMSETISVHNMFSPGLSLEFSCIELLIQWTFVIILWISWCKNKSFWQRFTCIFSCYNFFHEFFWWKVKLLLRMLTFTERGTSQFLPVSLILIVKIAGKTLPYCQWCAGATADILKRRLEICFVEIIYLASIFLYKKMPSFFNLFS